MISPAFWLVQGNYIKVSRSDDSSNTWILETSSCTGWRTFRSFITSFGNFRYSITWNSNTCHGSCSVNYHSGPFRSTEGFNQVHCSNSNIGGWDYTCSSGVTGVMVMEPWWWLVEEVVHAAGRTMKLVSQRLMKQALTHRILRATLVTIAAPEAQVTHSIFGLN